MKITICLPTYNERHNIEALISAIFQQQTELKDHEKNILVIDDNSPDGTANIVRSLQRSFDKLHLITGKKEGLGAAYIRGFRFALKELKADIVMEMDADFSHDPTDIPRMLEPLSDGTSFVIGSRYVPGGSVPDDWGFYRVLNSQCANIFARFVAGLWKVNDCTAGFRSIKSSLLDKIDLSDLGVKGYAFQIVLLERAINAGAVIQEIQVNFTDRKYGNTKMSLKDILEFMMNCWLIRMRKLETFFRFSMVGMSGVLVNLGSFSLLYNLLGISKFLASPVAIEISIVSNFLLNNIWTFGGKKTEDKLLIRRLKFNFVSLLSLGISYGTFVLLMTKVPDMIPQLAQALGIIPATLVNYFMNFHWTFKEREI
jgi:dolichol-phosphate mannosyltransferase